MIDAYTPFIDHYDWLIPFDHLHPTPHALGVLAKIVYDELRKSFPATAR